MCAPTKDQVIQHICQRLDAANHWVLQQTRHDRDALWTRPVKTALCNACHAAWGACSPIWICATGVDHRDSNSPKPGRAAHQGEWLYDVTCFQYEEPWPTGQKVLLVAEVEWGGRSSPGAARAAVLEDFAKLLVARAGIRVMVYNLDHIPIADLVDYIHQCPDSQPGDAYLFAAFADGGINYHVEII